MASMVQPYIAFCTAKHHSPHRLPQRVLRVNVGRLNKDLYFVTLCNAVTYTQGHYSSIIPS